jgi:predicted Fe-Mo cluster-binding NifX family protein
MKIAVASTDGASISHHFGRSLYFLVYEIEGNKVINQEKRENTATAHAKGECNHGHTNDNEPHHHDHDAIVIVNSTIIYTPCPSLRA